MLRGAATRDQRTEFRSGAFEVGLLLSWVKIYSFFVRTQRRGPPLAFRGLLPAAPQPTDVTAAARGPCGPERRLSTPERMTEIRQLPKEGPSMRNLSIRLMKPVSDSRDPDRALPERRRRARAASWREEGEAGEGAENSSRPALAGGAGVGAGCQETRDDRAMVQPLASCRLCCLVLASRVRLLQRGVAEVGLPVFQDPSVPCPFPCLGKTLARCSWGLKVFETRGRRILERQSIKPTGSLHLGFLHGQFWDLLREG